MRDAFAQRGFLPPSDPLTVFPEGSPHRLLDEVGAQLPDRLTDPQFRMWAQELPILPFDEPLTLEALPELRLYYMRLGFLASGYVNQVGVEPTKRLPANIAEPLMHACSLLGRPPMLSYDGYALYNWYRLDPDKPIRLDNIDTIQNFVKCYDEHWFILIHVEIEAMAASLIDAILGLDRGLLCNDEAVVGIAKVVRRQTDVLSRIPEHMSPDVYFNVFRPYIRFFENMQYEGKHPFRASFRGETGAQSSVIPLLAAFFKIPHEPSGLTQHLADMRRYMPCTHGALIEHVAAMAPVRDHTSPAAFNDAMEAIAEFRNVHYGWAVSYIATHVSDPLGTGGTPYMSWLKQLIDETLAYRI